MRTLAGGNGQPYARYSSSFHPAPMPRTRRPPESAWRLAAIFARCAGLRKLLQSTSWPQSLSGYRASVQAKRLQPSATLWPAYWTWSGSQRESKGAAVRSRYGKVASTRRDHTLSPTGTAIAPSHSPVEADRKSTRLNSSHLGISYAVFCLKKKNDNNARVQVVTRGAPRPFTG